MPAGGEILAAGQYTATYGGVALGMFEGDAGVPTLEHLVKSEPVDNTATYGKATLDHIYQGVDYFISMICLEYRAGPLAAFWPWASTLGQMGIIARLAYDLSAPLVLTTIAGTPAATTGPATLTANKTILTPGFMPRVLFGPTLRKIPLRLQLLPYDSGGGNIAHYVMA